jgi:Na+-transporting methylmalonyl-CoA/oxaloacetate decarboxylase gamma subunit
MLQKSRELLFSLVAIVFITILYLLMVAIYRTTPVASGFYGHAMGVLGFILMLMTEILYTVRKRMNNARWGRMASWLEFHIFTGLVGPFLVLLHTSWTFNGLAGVLSLLTLVIVISGFIGRYIYTAVPRTVDGVELSLAEMNDQIHEVEDKLAALQPSDRESKTTPLVSPAFAGPVGLVLGRLSWEIQSGLAQRRAQRGLNGEARQHAHDLQNLVHQRERLKRQVASRATARRLLAVWHAVHIPLGLTLFAMAFVHVIGAIYYATLLR